MTIVKGIDSNLYYQSISDALNIFYLSKNLRDKGVVVEYAERDPFFTRLLGSSGHETFVPKVSPQIKKTFKEILEEECDSKVNVVYGSLPLSSIKWLLDVNRISNVIANEITVQDLVNNKVPPEVYTHLKACYSDKLVKFKSPKLSKLLVTLLGEQSKTVKWFTNDCPKNITIGENDNYRITLSILPHHIAGMSYYAPLNHGGDKWITGWNGTSCTDPIRNSDGEGVYCLPPSLKDNNLAIAYLTSSEDDDVFHPRFLARALVRYVTLPNGKNIMVGLKTYYVSTEAENILYEGLANHYDNFYNIKEIRRFGFKDFIKIKMDLHDIVYTIKNRKVCFYCNGDGIVGSDYERCYYCDGDGYMYEDYRYYPYIDDDDLIERITTNYIIFRLPKKFLINKGLMTKEELEETLIVA